jgi:hypothetical protein
MTETTRPRRCLTEVDEAMARLWEEWSWEEEEESDE